MNFYYELFINPCDSLKNALRQHPEGKNRHRPRQLTFSVIATDLRPQGAAFLSLQVAISPCFWVFFGCVHTWWFIPFATYVLKYVFHQEFRV